MRVLLDTHALIWAIVSPSRLSPSVVAILEDTSNARIVSSASAWEISTKSRLGKLAGIETLVDSFSSQLRTLRAETLPVSVEHALLAGSLSWQHRDPFDRMLAAQALIEGIPLLTNDPVFAANGVPVLW